jgi:hypothetical protein
MDNNTNLPTNFEHDLQTILTEYLSDTLSRNMNEGDRTFYTRQPIPHPHIPHPHIPHPHIPQLHIPQHIPQYILPQPIRQPSHRLDTNHILNDLQQNITQYNNNINQYLQICQESLHQNRRPNIPPIRNTQPPYNIDRPNSTQHTRANDSIWSGLFADHRHTTHNNHQNEELFTNLSQNVIVRPTPDEIERASEIVEYSTDASDNFINHRCPISLEEFRHGDNIRRITHCGHSFNEESFQNWFHRNVGCPVCRFDIRETTASLSDDNEIQPPVQEPTMDRDTNTTEPDNSPSLQSLFDGIADELSSSLTHYMQNADISNNTDISNNRGIIIDIPVHYTEIYDSSNNFIRRDFN